MIQPFDPKTASEADWDAVYEFNNRLQAEAWPEDPIQPREQLIREWQNPNPLFSVARFVAWQDGKIVGLSGAWIGRTGANEHLIDVGVDVVPEYRCQGIGKALLAPMVELARHEGRSLMLFGSVDVIPAGEAVLRHLDAEPGMLSHLNQLTLTDLDRDLMRQWVERACERASGYTLVECGDRYPDEDIAAIAEMLDATNDAPHDDLEIEDEHRTPEQLRQAEDARIAQGVQRWCMYIREDATRDLAGFTEVFWTPSDPAMLGQGWTAVLPQYRNLGLGRWLKAAMILKALEKWPTIKRVRTGNADSNGPMLGINHAMGFKPYRAWTVWQIEVDKVAAYLAGEMQPVLV
jgi:GNAT superfamily N-acetyltransferase